jgi:hypothetical protein
MITSNPFHPVVSRSNHVTMYRTRQGNRWHVFNSCSARGRGHTSISGDDAASFRRRRYVELKHGRVLRAAHKSRFPFNTATKNMHEPPNQAGHEPMYEPTPMSQTFLMSFRLTSLKRTSRLGGHVRLPWLHRSWVLPLARRFVSIPWPEVQRILTSMPLSHTFTSITWIWSCWSRNELHGFDMIWHDWTLDQNHKAKQGRRDAALKWIMGVLQFSECIFNVMSPCHIWWPRTWWSWCYSYLEKSWCSSYMYIHVYTVYIYIRI